MKRILVLSTVCSGDFYRQLISMRTKPALDTQQKFMLSIVEGLAENGDVKVDCISVVPVSRSNYPEKKFRQFTEEVNGITFTYVGFTNFPIIKNVTAAASMKKAAVRYYSEHKTDEIYVIADGLSAEASEAALALKKKGVGNAAIVTDIPLIAETMGGRVGIRAAYSRFYGTRANRLLLRYDRYVLLSEYMNEVVNPDRKKPFMVMECIVDPDLFERAAVQPDSEKPSVLYAGKFYRECGVVEFARAAKELKDTCEIWLYGGHGDCTDELEQLARENPNLRIHGIVPLEEILGLEKACTLLINPRFAEEEFSKYSFPSKTAEYMLSGTPVMMYRLPSLPKEYEEHVYIIEEEGTTLAESIKNVLERPASELREKGIEASRYIRENKNRTIQAKRILEFIR